MRYTTLMNQYIKHNQEGVKKVEQFYGRDGQWSFREILLHVNWSDLGSTNNMLHLFICVSCGDHVNTRVLDFFNFDVERVQCYKCQRKNKVITK